MNFLISEFLKLSNDESNDIDYGIEFYNIVQDYIKKNENQFDEI